MGPIILLPRNSRGWRKEKKQHDCWIAQYVRFQQRNLPTQSHSGHSSDRGTPCDKLWLLLNLMWKGPKCTHILYCKDVNFFRCTEKTCTCLWVIPWSIKHSKQHSAVEQCGWIYSWNKIALCISITISQSTCCLPGQPPPPHQNYLESEVQNTNSSTF